jgi:hypothetical protein
MPGGTDDRRPTSWTARVVAPLVLVAVAAAIVLVISGSLSGSDDDDDGDRGGETTSQACTPDAQDAVKNGYYVVQADDVTGLSGIADKTCIPLETLIELNPNLDPQALQVSNCVDLVADGCKKLTQG